MRSHRVSVLMVEEVRLRVSRKCRNTWDGRMGGNDAYKVVPKYKKISKILGLCGNQL